MCEKYLLTMFILSVVYGIILCLRDYYHEDFETWARKKMTTPKGRL